VDNNGVNSIPSVIAVGPFGGPDAGGNHVKIYGSGFTGATGVKFGGVAVAANNFTVLHDWVITATVPAYSGGTECDEDGSFYGTGVEWRTFGDPSDYFSQANPLSIVTITGTKIQILAPTLPGQEITIDSVTVPVAVKAVAGQSAPIDATYAGVPQVFEVTATDG